MKLHVTTAENMIKDCSFNYQIEINFFYLERHLFKKC